MVAQGWLGPANDDAQWGARADRTRRGSFVLPPQCDDRRLVMGIKFWVTIFVTTQGGRQSGTKGCPLA